MAALLLDVSRYRAHASRRACIRSAHAILGTRIASSMCVLMAYETIPIVIVLAIPLIAGLALIVDAVRRAIHEARRSGHDLHV